MTLRALSLLMLAAAVHAAPTDDSRRMAADISRVAQRFSIKRAAVVSFSGVTGRDSVSGAVVSERLAQKLVASGSIDVVDRDVLAKAFEARTGTAKKLTPSIALAVSKSIGVDAVITGTVLELRDGRVEVNARVIETGTGKVVAATSGRVEKDWSNFADDPAPWDMPMPPVPTFEGAPVVNVSWSPERGREVEIYDCRGARHEVGQMERSMTDIKARFWAIKLKERDFSLAKLKRNPGSEIADPQLKEFFYSRLRYWFQEDYVPGLTQDEFKVFKRYQKLMEMVASSCGV